LSGPEIVNFVVWHLPKTRSPTRLQILYFGPIFMVIKV
jgi:hypothetical protein